MSVRIIDLPALATLNDNDIVELCAAYLECQPERQAAETDLLRWIARVETAMIDVSLVKLVLERKVQIAWSDDDDDFIFRSADD